MMEKLQATKHIEIRFSEVDSMNVVWHGSYPLYFEDAREEFGRRYGLGYMTICGHGYFAPLVELTFKYKRAMRYGTRPVVEITYVPAEAAKIIFDYVIRDAADGTVYATGRSVQVFMDRDYKLVWESPEFYRKWKEQWGQ